MKLFPPGPGLPRRRFVQGLALGAGALALGVPRLSAAATGDAPELRGDTFHLDIGRGRVNLTGNPRFATLVNNSLPAPTLRWKEGQDVTLHVANHLDVDTSIHWHGMILPAGMDGVPGLSFPGIPPGQTFTYRFPVRQAGTYWYHSHSGFQEQTGLYGAIIIDPADQDPVGADRDHVLVLSDWSDEDPERIYAKLKKLSHYYNFNERTLADLARDVREKGVAATWRDRSMWNRMRMSDRDLADVTGYTYTYLVNGRTPAGNWTGLFHPGERVRLRVINASAMTFFDVRIPGLEMTVVAADGQPVKPVTVEEFRIGVAETYDVIVTPKPGAAYTVFAQSIDRSGFARATLTSDPSLVAEVPAMDPAPVLGHREMGMGHAGHDEAAAHAGHGMTDAGTGRDAHRPTGPDHDAHRQHAPKAGREVPRDRDPLEHAASEYGPGVDMRAERPVRMLDDPGLGLRDNGRRVLTYADLASLDGPPDSLHPDREITLHLTGNMSRYMWSFDGIAFADAEPIRLRHGERVRINLVNDTMMHHPIHLHGMWSDLETGPNRLARKHTLTVKPGEILSCLVRADAPGAWAYHCHLLYHMDAGMFRTVIVADQPDNRHDRHRHREEHP